LNTIGVSVDRLEESTVKINYVVVIINDGNYAPLIENSTGMRNTATNLATDFQSNVIGERHIRMLVV
jgi:hypothetical protein